MGYEICRLHYENSTDKKEAVRQMIELDYADQAALWQFVDRTGFFSNKMSVYHSEYSASQPKVVSIKEFRNGDKGVDPTISTLTVVFSVPRDTRYRNMRLGSLGEANLLDVTGVTGWSEDKTMLTYQIALKPGTRQQITLWHHFRSAQGRHLEPYLIDIITRN